MAVLGDKPSNILPTVEELRQMTYLHMVVKEVSRQVTFPWAVISIKCQ